MRIEVLGFHASPSLILHNSGGEEAGNIKNLIKAEVLCTFSWESMEGMGPPSE